MNDYIDLSGLTFNEIAEEYGLETAIQAGIAADPDTWELTEEDFAQMRPGIEVDPELIHAWRASRVSHASHPPPAKNQLFFGDNLDILRNHVADASVDLIYLDPPFNSNASYNVLFHEETGHKSAAQITAFEDTWHWSLESEVAYQDVVTNATGKLPALAAGHATVSRNQRYDGLPDHDGAAHGRTAIRVSSTPSLGPQAAISRTRAAASSPMGTPFVIASGAWQSR